MVSKFLNVYVNHPDNILMRGSAKIYLDKTGKVVLKMKSGTTYSEVGRNYFNQPVFGINGLRVKQPDHIMYPDGFKDWSYPRIVKEIELKNYEAVVLQFTFHNKGKEVCSVDVKVDYE